MVRIQYIRLLFLACMRGQMLAGTGTHTAGIERKCPQKQCHAKFRGHNYVLSLLYLSSSGRCGNCCPFMAHFNFSRIFDGNRLMPEDTVNTCSALGTQQLINIIVSTSTCRFFISSWQHCGSLSLTNAALSIYMPLSMNSNERRCCWSVF